MNCAYKANNKKKQYDKRRYTCVFVFVKCTCK